VNGHAETIHTGSGRKAGEDVARVRLHVPGMACRTTVRVVTAHLRDVPGVESLNADPATGELWVVGAVLEATLRRELTGMGFPAAPAET
jgi:copper chaperone CopZ